MASPIYPAVLAKTAGGLAVGAVDSTNVVAAAFSNDAETLVPYDFVVAPGVSIYSSYVGKQYAVGLVDTVEPVALTGVATVDFTELAA